jgi:outer membrane protein assembly factor BamB
MIAMRRGPALLATGLLVAAGCTGAEPSSIPATSEPDPAPVTAYADGWSAVHADAANTDYSPIEVGDDLELAWDIRIEGSIRIGPLPWTINLGPTIDPSGRVFLTSTEPGCHLRALDGATGELVWCDEALDLFTVVSSPLLDRDGRLYIADGAGMHALDRDGARLWDVPLDGVPLSSQFTPEGHLVFITHVGTVHVLDRTDGSAVLDPVPLAPGVSWDEGAGMFACARGTEACPSANTIAVDAGGRLFFTLWAPGAPAAALVAVQLEAGDEPSLRELWRNDALPGGSASSPVLSSDGTRVYVTDNVDSLHALDAGTGEVLWTVAIGYAAGGSPSLAPDGLIMPAGGGQSPVLAVRDRGDHGEVAWQRDDLVNRGVATQAAGGRAYVTVQADSFANQLVVLDTADGSELDRVDLPGASVFSVGTTIGPDGTVYVPTIVGGLHALRAA